MGRTFRILCQQNRSLFLAAANVLRVCKFGANNFQYYYTANYSRQKKIFSKLSDKLKEQRRIADCGLIIFSTQLE